MQGELSPEVTEGLFAVLDRYDAHDLRILINPSGSSTHLPLHKGGSGWAVSELLTSVRSASQQTGTAVGGPGGGLKRPRCPLVTFGQSKVTEKRAPAKAYK